MNKELAKAAGMKENVSLITDGCDNMLSKVQDEDDDDYQRRNRPSFHIIHVIQIFRFVTWNMFSVASV